MATQFNSLDLSAVHERSLTNWSDWILLESARRYFTPLSPSPTRAHLDSIHRLCVVYQIVNMLVYFEPAAMCDTSVTGLHLERLPAKRQLWAANNEVAWRKEGTSGSLQTAYGLAVNGDLVRVGQDWSGDGIVSSVPSTSTANWQDWCAGIDGLGSLVMLAASLVA